MQTLSSRGSLQKSTMTVEVRQHILKMSNITFYLKPKDMWLKDKFIVHLIMVSLPKVFEPFVANYNSQLEKEEE
jgi:hypothetical protein